MKPPGLLQPLWAVMFMLNYAIVPFDEDGTVCNLLAKTYDDKDPRVTALDDHPSMRFSAPFASATTPDPRQPLKKMFLDAVSPQVIIWA
jgi:hypothetical protein